MPAKQFQLNDLSVTVTKRRSSRQLRLTITPKGEARVSIPLWAPYKIGLEFAKSRQRWINAQIRPRLPLVHNQPIGKAHYLQLLAAPVTRPRTRVMQSTVTVHYPQHLSWRHPQVQNLAETASIRALKHQAEALLPKRLNELAERHGFTYNHVSIKQLKSRWGSCDSERNIVLNLFLVQLPWDCIDYVLLHELTHTEVLRHGPDFWQAMTTVLPNTKELRKRLRSYQPLVQTVPPMS